MEIAGSSLLSRVYRWCIPPSRFRRPRLAVPKLDLVNADPASIKIKTPEINHLSHSAQADLLKRFELLRKEFNQLRSADKAFWQAGALLTPEEKVIRDKLVTKHLQCDLLDPRTHYLEHPVIQVFIEDFKTGNDYARTRAVIDALQPNFIIGAFQADYNPDMDGSLECLTFDFLDLGHKIQGKYPSNAVAAINLKSTPGFVSLLSPALFPENFVTAAEDDPSSKAYYFVGKFKTRVDRFTSAVLKHNIDEKSFPALRLALKESPERVLDTINAWLSTHEYFHSQGYVPRVNRAGANPIRDFGFKLKDTKETGAWEELRVDLEALISLTHPDAQAVFGSQLCDAIYDLILAERLLRYPIQKDPNDNFDSITSHVLLDNLRRTGAIKINGAKLSIKTKESVTETLKDLLARMNQLEDEIQQDLRAKVLNIDTLKFERNKIQEFMRKEVGENAYDASIDTQTSKPIGYKLDPFYKLLRKTCNYEPQKVIEEKKPKKLPKTASPTKVKLLDSSSDRLSREELDLQFYRQQKEFNKENFWQKLARKPIGDFGKGCPPLIYFTNLSLKNRLTNEMKQAFDELLVRIFKDYLNTIPIEERSFAFTKIKRILRAQLKECWDTDKGSKDLVEGWIKEGEKIVQAKNKTKTLVTLTSAALLLGALCLGNKQEPVQAINNPSSVLAPAPPEPAPIPVLEQYDLSWSLPPKPANEILAALENDESKFFKDVGTAVPNKATSGLLKKILPELGELMKDCGQKNLQVGIYRANGEKIIKVLPNGILILTPELLGSLEGAEELRSKLIEALKAGQQYVNELSQNPKLSEASRSANRGSSRIMLGILDKLQSKK